MAKKKKTQKQKEQPSLKKGLLVDNQAYIFTPSFIEHNGKVATLLTADIIDGTNRELTFEDVMSFIPTDTMNGIEMYIITDDAVINGDEKKRLIEKNSKHNKDALEVGEVETEKAGLDNKAEKRQVQSRKDDYDDYGELLGSSSPIVIFRWMLLIVGETREQVDEQIDVLQAKLNKDNDGFSWINVAGDQRELFTNILGKIEKNDKYQTSTGTNYAGLNLVVSTGLRDSNGIPLGVDALSITESISYFDFVKSTQKQGMIALPRSSFVTRFRKEESTLQISASSIIAQAAANQFAMEGKRVQHIVLNDFDYLDNESKFIRPNDYSGVLEEYDVTKVTINPLQGFGEYSDITNIYERLVQKIVNIFDVLSDLKLEKNEKAYILDAVKSFCLRQGLYTTDADKYPKRTNLIKIKKPELHPTLGDFLSEFSIQSDKALTHSREMKADAIEVLEKNLEHALTSYTSALARTTTIVDSNALQVYYSFKESQSTTFKQIQFMNILDYILYQAKEGELVVIHGYDNIYKKISEMVYPAIKAAQNRGVKFIFAFDSITATRELVDEMCDMFTMKGNYYKDMDTDMDYAFIGTCLPEEVDKIREVLNKTLGTTVESMLINKRPNQVMINRKVGSVNNFVRINPII